MTDKQPEALRLADLLMRDVGSQLVNRKQAAAELRRLHAQTEGFNHLLSVERMARETLQKEVADLKTAIRLTLKARDRYGWSVEADAAIEAMRGLSAGESKP